MRSFSSLKFKPRAGGGVQALSFFDNGCGVSVVKGPGTYGNEDGLYELAVLAGSKDDWQITYETSITSDVIGHLTKKDVTALLKRISAL